MAGVAELGARLQKETHLRQEPMVEIGVQLLHWPVMTQHACGGVRWRIVIFLISTLRVVDPDDQIKRFFNSIHNSRSADNGDADAASSGFT